jgi:hypothetical protein
VEAILKEALKHLSYLPRYFSQLIRLAIEPKRFLSELPSADQNEIRISLIFLVATNFIQIVTLLPFSHQLGGSVAWCASTTVFNIIGVMVFSLAIHSSCCAAGGATGASNQCWVFCNYVAGTAALMFGLISSLGTYVILVVDHDLYEQLYGWVKTGQKITLKTSLQVNLIYLSWALTSVGFAVTAAWFVLSWGAFRNMYSLSKLRSLFAFMLATISGVPIILIAFFITIALAKAILRGE